jgi:hypothetical protein
MNLQTLVAAPTAEDVTRALFASGGPMPEPNFRLPKTRRVIYSV